jgi:threonine dehydrogenase-like Zn-dependent dehydrogenase
MKALWLEDRTLRFRDDLAVPQPAAGEALIRVLRAGICNTDLEMVGGYYPFAGVLGHEFVGVVEEGPQDLEGQRVVGEINVSCGACPACERGHRTHCETREILGIRGRNGAFAEYLTLPVINLHPVPREISTDAATFAEPLAAALRIQDQVSIAAEDRVLVVGSGKLGRLIAQTLALTGCQLQVVGRRRQEIPLPGAESLNVESVAAVPAASFDVAVECTGNSEGFEIARRALRPRGRLVMKSTYAGRLELDVSTLVVDEIQLVGSRCGSFPPALRLLAAGQVDVMPLIGSRFPLHRGLEAVNAARQPGALKVLLDVDNGSR